MGFNYGLETKKFNERWNKLRAEYEAAGMNEAEMQAMRDFDWDWLKSERRHRTHNQPLVGAIFAAGDNAGEDQSPLLENYLEQLSAGQPEISEWGRYDWIEDLETPELAGYIKSLRKVDLELLTAMVADGLSRADLSREMNISRAAVTKRVNPIKKSLEKLLTEVNKTTLSLTAP